MVIRDVIRLSKRVVGECSVRPRPVLVKFTTVWDKQLILVSKKKMKGFRVGGIFIRQDLSPEDRVSRRPRLVTHAGSPLRDSSPHAVSSLPISPSRAHSPLSGLQSSEAQGTAGVSILSPPLFPQIPYPAIVLFLFLLHEVIAIMQVNNDYIALLLFVWFLIIVVAGILVLIS